MIIKEVKARAILDSRKEKTVEIRVVTGKGEFTSSAPSGKSKGRFEAKPYFKNLKKDISFLNNLKEKEIGKLKINEFRDLREVEGLVSGKVGANSLFSFESSILKALAGEQGKEVWELLSRGKPKKFPIPVGNAIGGGLHTELKQGEKPDFQEFLFLGKGKRFSDAVSINKDAYKLAGKILESREVNDEGAWETKMNNDQVLSVMSKVRDEIQDVGMGIDAAASTFYKKGEYNYYNRKNKINKKQQVGYMTTLARVFTLDYIEDPLEENDFSGFKELGEGVEGMIVGDDLTVTNLLRLKKARNMKAINAIIIKPNQQGSLLKVKEICDFCLKKGIKTVFSHRSGETEDTIIVDLALAWKADFIKTGIFGKEREVKLKRLEEIEESL